jgi:sulfur carrier protein ThiS
MHTPGSEAGSGVDITAMQITFKLFAGLTDYLPAEHRRGNQMALEVEPEATIARIIEPFRMPPHLVHIVLVNGVYVAPADRATRTLVEGDVLAIWPPVAGG